MSDDLVKRLRQYPDVKLPNEAADRIEKLEAALREIATDSALVRYDVQLICRIALEEKDD